jgi:CO/xanthine dehydrogenase Mo-binding subunit
MANPKKFCKNGHPFVGENLYQYISKSGKDKGHLVRECKECATRKNHRRAKNLRANHLLRKFGMTLQQYDSMLAEQDGKCFVCHVSSPGRKGSFHVDHDHGTGKVRSLLCLRCNSTLGNAGDDPALLEKLAKYLREFAKV